MTRMDNNESHYQTLIKSFDEQEKMRVAGRLAARVLEYLEPFVHPGISTMELDERAHHYIVDTLDAIPAPLNYHGFPKSICTSINHVICHGIPGAKKLKSGDIINIDITVIKEGYHGDTSSMFLVGRPGVLGKRLSEVARKAMFKGINLVRPKVRLGDIGAVIQHYAESRGFSVVRDYCGHGIGRHFHEPPQILHYGTPGTGLELEAGMTFTIEPMINAGHPESRLLPDGWTAVTRDHSLSAQWEHTILVTDNGHEILTLREGEEIPVV